MSRANSGGDLSWPVSICSCHIAFTLLFNYWQEANGSWFDATVGDYFLTEAQTNTFGVINYRSPLTVGDEETVLTNLVSSQDISEVFTSGVLTTQTKTRKNLTVPLGRCSAFKVKSREELNIPNSPGLATIVVDQAHWVVPYIGPVLIKLTQRSYDSQGNLIETETRKLEATRVNF